jgi:hypothetical protein
MIEEILSYLSPVDSGDFRTLLACSRVSKSFLFAIGPMLFRDVCISRDITFLGLKQRRIPRKNVLLEFCTLIKGSLHLSDSIRRLYIDPSCVLHVKHPITTYSPIECISYSLLGIFRTCSPWFSPKTPLHTAPFPFNRLAASSLKRSHQHYGQLLFENLPRLQDILVFGLGSSFILASLFKLKEMHNHPSLRRVILSTSRFYAPLLSGGPSTSLAGANGHVPLQYAWYRPEIWTVDVFASNNLELMGVGKEWTPSSLGEIFFSRTPTALGLPRPREETSTSVDSGTHTWKMVGVSVPHHVWDWCCPHSMPVVPPTSSPSLEFFHWDLSLTYKSRYSEVAPGT